MGDPKGFLKVKREISEYRPVCERIKDYKEALLPKSEERAGEQASRCMDCGTPFCHWACPVGNYIPEWNDLAFRGNWDKAIALLEATNNMPEVTGRICPAPCEYACVLGINDDPVTVRDNELAIIEHAFKVGLIRPRPPRSRTGRKVAVVGSGPAGLAAAAQLNRAGHNVVLFERDDKVGGILRYGIPDFKLEKWVLDRRVNIWKEEGVEFRTSVNIGGSTSLTTSGYPASRIVKEFDAVVLAGGSRAPRDLKIEGRRLSGIYFAMDYLVQSNRKISGEAIPRDKLIDAKGKQVLVIGGGDTGADCVGTAHRQGAACVVQIEVLPRPPQCRTDDMPWPRYPLLLKTSTSHEEGGERQWAVLTKKFAAQEGRVRKVSCVKVDFSEKDAAGCPVMKEVAGSGFDIETDLVILAIGFLGPEREGLVAELGLALDGRGNVKTDENYMSSAKNVFACGDMRRGQSLVVWAIAEGRRSAHYIDKYLMGETNLPII